MKLFQLGFFLVALATLVAAEEKRLCPDGYFYAGDDTLRHLKSGNGDDDGMVEVDRSPTYSCYKVIDGDNTWITANLECGKDESQLVSFEDLDEMIRVRDHLVYEKVVNEPVVELLTSALHFGEEELDSWMWVGSNSSIDANFMKSDELDYGDLEKQCLVLRMNKADKIMSVLKPVECLQKQKFTLCEARVQTVTYYTWFVGNWVTMLLIFLLIVLVISLCVSISMFTKRNGRRERIYRQRISRDVINDLPPSYTDVTGTKSAPQANRFDQYRQRGREILARVYLYRDDGKATPRN